MPHKGDPRADSFCVLPWAGLEVSADGTRSCCCQCQLKLLPEFEREADPGLQRLKNEMLAGKRPAECSFCWQIEDRKGGSQRTEFLKHYSDLAKSILANPTQSTPVKVLSLKVGNVCNQKCLICGPRVSSLWMTEPVYLDRHQKPVMPGWTKIVRNDISALKADIAEADRIYLSGGEPLLSTRPLEQLLQIVSCEENPLPKKLLLVTNGSMPFDFDLLKRLEDREVEVSIFMSADGTHEQFNYQRYPATWTSFLQNYQTIRGSHFFGGIGIAVSSLNLFYVEDYLRYWEERGEFRLCFNFLNYPEIMSVTTMPQAVLLQVREKMLRARFKHKQTADLFEPLIYFVQELIQERSRANELQDFMGYVRFYDQHRQTSFEKVFPEYYGLLSVELTRSNPTPSDCGRELDINSTEIKRNEKNDAPGGTTFEPRF